MLSPSALQRRGPFAPFPLGGSGPGAFCIQSQQQQRLSSTSPMSFCLGQDQAPSQSALDSHAKQDSGMQATVPCLFWLPPMLGAFPFRNVALKLAHNYSLYLNEDPC